LYATTLFLFPGSSLDSTIAIFDFFFLKQSWKENQEVCRRSSRVFSRVVVALRARPLTRKSSILQLRILPVVFLT
jgi:hypothetical protein